MANRPTLYLIPVPIRKNGLATIPPEVLKIIPELEAIVAESAKLARRFVKSINKDQDVSLLKIIEMDKKGEYRYSGELEVWFKRGVDMGLMSDAGIPCIADPGSLVVKMARAFGYCIKPLSGPSSIFMALMASGLNGQQFHFHGYLPIKRQELTQKLKSMNRELKHSDASQIFIETPYRNRRLVQFIIDHIDSEYLLCVACEIGHREERIETMKISKWEKELETSFREKRACVFILGK